MLSPCFGVQYFQDFFIQSHGECFQLLHVVVSSILEAQAPDFRQYPTITPDILKTTISRVGIKQTTNGSTVYFSTNWAIKRCFWHFPHLVGEQFLIGHFHSDHKQWSFFPVSQNIGNPHVMFYHHKVFLFFSNRSFHIWLLYQSFSRVSFSVLASISWASSQLGSIDGSDKLI